MTLKWRAHNNQEWARLLGMLPPLDLLDGPWIAGGSARKLFLGQDWNSGDIDVFFRNHYQRLNWVHAFEKKFKISGSDLWGFNDPDDDDLGKINLFLSRRTPECCASIHLETDNATHWRKS